MPARAARPASGGARRRRRPAHRRGRLRRRRHHRDPAPRALRRLRSSDLELALALRRGERRPRRPCLWPTSALPTGDSLESFISAGLASAEPTIVYLSFSPSPSTTWTVVADPDDIRVEVRGVDHGRRAKLVLELRDPRLEHRLLVLGVVVLGVLGDVAELARLLDPGGDLAAAHGRHVLELGLEVGEPFGGENDVLWHKRDPGCWVQNRKPAAQDRTSSQNGRGSIDRTQSTRVTPAALTVEQRSGLHQRRRLLQRRLQRLLLGSACRRAARCTTGRTCAGSGSRAPRRGARPPDRAPRQPRRGSPRGSALRRWTPGAAGTATGCRATRAPAAPRRRPSARTRPAPARRCAGRPRSAPEPVARRPAAAASP